MSGAASSACSEVATQALERDKGRELRVPAGRLTDAARPPGGGSGGEQVAGPQQAGDPELKRRRGPAHSPRSESPWPEP